MKNQKLHSLIICALLMSAMFSIILVSMDTASATSGFPLTITDSAGRVVTINASVDGIIVLNTDAAEAVTILGKQDKIIGISRTVQEENILFPELSGREMVMADWRGPPNIERIINLSQNLNSVIILTYTTGGPGPDVLENRLTGLDNIKVIRLDFFKADTMKTEMQTLGRILEAEARANQYIEMHDRIVDHIRGIVRGIPPNERALVFTGGRPDPATGPVTGWRAAGPGTGTYALAEMAGARNINTGRGRDWFTVPLEWLLAERPAKVMLWSAAGGYAINCPFGLRDDRFNPFINAPGARTIPAVPYNVFVFDSDIGTSPAFFVTVATLVEWWYPDKFNLCHQSIHQEYIDTFFPGIGFNVRTQGAFIYHRIPVLPPVVGDPGVTPPPILIVTTPVAPAIIEVEESVEIKTTKANVPVSIDIKKTNITEITITTLRDVSNIPLRVQQLTERPAEVPEIPDKIYRYFSITTGIKSEDIDNATITFNVSKSWINETNISIDSIRLNRFNTTNKQWDALPTKLIRKDVNNITFSAETPHFSIFSVTGKKVVPTRINVTPITATLNVTETRQFTATVLPTDANQTVSWSVTNETVGTINATGFFTARARGTVNVITTSVVDKNITRTATVTVVIPPIVTPPALTRINVTPTTATLNVTETRQFTAIVLPADANQTVTWSITNETVGTINATGFFTARARGTVNVITTSVVDRNITGTATVTVVVLPVETKPAPRIPGFGIMAAMVGILGVVLIILKKKK